MSPAIATGSCTTSTCPTDRLLLTKRSSPDFILHNQVGGDSFVPTCIAKLAACALRCSVGSKRSQRLRRHIRTSDRQIQGVGRDVLQSAASVVRRRSRLRAAQLVQLLQPGTADECEALAALAEDQAEHVAVMVQRLARREFIEGTTVGRREVEEELTEGPAAYVAWR